MYAMTVMQDIDIHPSMNMSAQARGTEGAHHREEKGIVP